MRLEQLTYFVETVSRGSISAASEALFTSHQNVSKALRQLEEELNLKLLKRTKNGVYLTPVGEPIFQYAQEALYNIELIKEAANMVSFNQPVDESLAGTVTITASPAFSYMFTSVIKTANLHYPNLTIAYNVLEPAHIYSMLASGNLESDMFFLSIEDSESNISMLKELGTLTILKEDALVAIAKKTSPLANYKTLSIKTLSEAPLAFYASSYSVCPLFLSLLLKYTDIKLKKCYRTNSTEVVQDYLYSGTVASVTSNLIKKRALNMPASQCDLIPLNVKIPLLHVGLLPNKTRKTLILTTILDIINDSCPETRAHPLLF